MSSLTAKLPTETQQAERRHVMVEEQLRRRGVLSPQVLKAMDRVPRHEFVGEQQQALAYADQPLQIGENQTISQPYMVAAMTEALELTAGENVLEVGTGSGYQTAVLALLSRWVISIERHEVLAEGARERLNRLGFANITVIHGDGTLGWPEAGPYHAVLVTAGAPHVPAPLVEQLAEGGRLVIPVGGADQQDLLRLRKTAGRVSTETLNLCRFVPLVGRHGWKQDRP